ncbi:hypothetical protein GTO27_13505, partial [Candidatus Bathyarchaeota archaeon]|nr:hypothetical protein [Candidatus Bathyarchaeota archaeon]
WERAKQLRDTGKIREAVIYLGEHYLGITVRNLADWLELGYWTVHRIMVSLTLYRPSQARHAIELLAVAANRQGWPDTYVDIYMDTRLTLEDKSKQLYERLTSS